MRDFGKLLFPLNLLNSLESCILSGSIRIAQIGPGHSGCGLYSPGPITSIDQHSIISNESYYSRLSEFYDLENQFFGFKVFDGPRNE